MKYTIDKNNRPVYLQIYRLLRDDIRNGAFPYQDKLPSRRLLAEEMGVSTITVEHAYALLCEEGYAAAKERSGYFVCFRPNDGFAAAAPVQIPVPVTVAAAPGFSAAVLSRTMRRVLSERRDALFERSPGTGCFALRDAIRRYLARNRGIQVSTDQIVVGAGAEYLYGLIVALLGRDLCYAIEAPAYQKLEQIYRTLGVAVEQLPLSRDGIDSAALVKTNADVLHTTPYRSYPSGVTASASKRHEYLRWANRAGRYLIESDYGSETSVSAQPMETLFALSHGDNVIYLNTFSRTISASLRVGYMVLPKSLAPVFAEKLGFYSCSVPTFEQYVLAQLIDGGDFERHINRLRRQKRKELAAQKQ